MKKIYFKNSTFGTMARIVDLVFSLVLLKEKKKNIMGLHLFETVELLLRSCLLRQFPFLWQFYLVGFELFSIELPGGPFGQQVFYL